MTSMSENNVNLANVENIEINPSEKTEILKLPDYYGNMQEKLTLDGALNQYDRLKLKDTISPKNSIKECVDSLNTSNVSEVSKLIIDYSSNIKGDSNTVIGIFALSPNNVSHLPPTEKDGITGLVVLSNALSALGFTVVIMTDSINQPILTQILSNTELFKYYVDINQEIGYAPKNLNLEKKKVYVVGVVPDPGIDSEWEEFLENIQKQFGMLFVVGRPSREIETGIYRSSRGHRINHYCSNLENIYIKVKQEDKIPTIALSDISENQLGIYQKDDSRNKYNANYIIVSHTIDWVCYYLTAGIALRFIADLRNLYFGEDRKADENSEAINEVNFKILQDSFQSFFPSEGTFIYLNDKIKELDVWDTQYGDGLKKGFTLESDWEVRMKIRRIVSQFGVPIDFVNV
ncbi:Serine/threonine protein kinase [Cryptosporidium felis]|nr:Serine/threonine protein kinase [Cryptosporidium felis]